MHVINILDDGKLSKIQIIAKHYSRCTCIIVDIENIDAGILRECSAGERSLGRGFIVRT